MSFLLIVPSLRFPTIIMMQDFKISNLAHHSVLHVVCTCSSYYYCIMGYNRSRNFRINRIYVSTSKASFSYRMAQKFDWVKF